MKRITICKRNWLRTLKVIALSSSLVFTGTSIIYGSTENMPPKHFQVNETEKPEQDGWVPTKSGWEYYENGEKTIGWKTISGKWYYFNKNAIMETGWVYIDSHWYYLNENGTMETGWIEVNNHWYYTDQWGAMCTGWVYVNGHWYYMDQWGAMCTGWVYVNEHWYYMDQWGAMCTGWVYVNGHYYYTDQWGAMCTGWVYVNGHYYYTDQWGAMCTGWVSVDGHWYYLNADGAMATGWTYVNGHYYYMDQWGAMQTGWLYVGGHWYYMDQWGAMQTGWLKVNGHWYYMDQWGAMCTGWLKLGGNWYYLNSDGTMMENSWLNNYYFNDNGLWSSPYIHLEEMQVSQKVSQIIFVETKGTHAQVSMHIKQADGSWCQLLRDNGRIGYGGLGKQKEGDKKTPAGCFSLDEIFGISPNPGAILPYLQVNKGHYWVGDNNSPYYNSLVDVNEIGYIFNTSASEHIISYGNVYNYCIAIGYNKEKIPYKGSAIFLHCSGAGATAGCVSVPEDTMIRIIQNIKDDAVIIIDTPSNMQKY